MKPGSLALALAGLALSACSSVHVVPTASATHAQPRPSDCPLELLRSPPEKPYDELAELTSHVTAPPKGGALEVLRPKACELGADAVIVLRDQVLNEMGHTLVAGIAIKFRPEPEQKPAAKPGGAVDL